MLLEFSGVLDIPSPLPPQRRLLGRARDAGVTKLPGPTLKAGSQASAASVRPHDHSMSSAVSSGSSCRSRIVVDRVQPVCCKIYCGKSTGLSTGCVANLGARNRDSVSQRAERFVRAASLGVVLRGGRGIRGKLEAAACSVRQMEVQFAVQPGPCALSLQRLRTPPRVGGVLGSRSPGPPGDLASSPGCQPRPLGLARPGRCPCSALCSVLHGG